MNFSKYSACGNDFVLIDNRKNHCPHNSTFIQKICERKLGIGADGVIFLENSQKADFKMRIFNADGSEAEMCGNGIRCLLRFIHQLGFDKNLYTIETFLRNLKIFLAGDLVGVDMGDPFDFQWNVSLPVDSKWLNVHYLNTGVPHTIFFTNDCDSMDLRSLGPKIRYHPQFSPKGTNVNLVQIEKDNTLSVRTYERGVEDETLACGTGVTAAAIAASRMHGLSSPVKIKVKSGDQLQVSFNLKENEVTDVQMLGPAQHIFNGTSFSLL